MSDDFPSEPFEVDLQSFLDSALNLQGDDEANALINVTLTFAQSVDAKIAGKNGKQLILSCRESMYMTHLMRSMHDAILIGIGTAINDNPQLNTRLLRPKDGRMAPIPIVLDSQLRLETGSKLVQNFLNGVGQRPIVVTMNSIDEEWMSQKRTLESLGISIISVQSDERGRLSLKDLLIKLKDRGVKSLMVEGGATVISSFLNSGLVHRLVVTVSPMLVGDDGVSYTAGQTPCLQVKSSKVIGRDTVIVWA